MERCLSPGVNSVYYGLKSSIFVEVDVSLEFELSVMSPEFPEFKGAFYLQMHRNTLAFVVRTFRCAALAGLKTRPSKTMQKIDCRVASRGSSQRQWAGLIFLLFLKREIKSRALAGRSFRPDCASVAVNNTLHRSQTDSRARIFFNIMQALKRSK